MLNGEFKFYKFSHFCFKKLNRNYLLIKYPII